MPEIQFLWRKKQREAVSAYLEGRGVDMERYFTELLEIRLVGSIEIGQQVQAGRELKVLRGWSQAAKKGVDVASEEDKELEEQWKKLKAEGKL